jgi:hypothetical protein
MHRSGVTRWDVVIVMLIVFTIGGLVVEGVRTVRENESKLITHNNLRQCALSIHGFHDNFKKLPNGTSPGGRYTKDISMWFQILPFVESNRVYSDGQITARFPAYVSPSEQYVDDIAGTLNFAANVRVFGHQTFRSDNQAVDQPGTALEIKSGRMFCGLTLGTIKDGIQNTIIFSTRYANCNGLKTWYAADALGGCELGKLPSPGVGGFMGAGSHDTPPSHKGPITAMYQATPSLTGCLPQPGVFGHSFTRKGLSVALCDGSVRVIAPSMSPTTFGRALCPGDGAKLGADWDAD